MDDDTDGTRLLQPDNELLQGRIMQDTFIISYLQGLKQVLAPEQVGSTNLWYFAQEILMAELRAPSSKDPNTPCIKEEYDNLRRELPNHAQHEWSSGVQLDSNFEGQELGNPDDIVLLKIKLLLRKKLEGEKKRHTAGSHNAQDDEVFNESDRIVKGLIQVASPPSSSTPGARTCSTCTLDAFPILPPCIDPVQCVALPALP